MLVCSVMLVKEEGGFVLDDGWSQTLGNRGGVVVALSWWRNLWLALRFQTSPEDCRRVLWKIYFIHMWISTDPRHSQGSHSICYWDLCNDTCHMRWNELAIYRRSRFHCPNAVACKVCKEPHRVMPLLFFFACYSFHFLDEYIFNSSPLIALALIILSSLRFFQCMCSSSIRLSGRCL